MKTLDELKQELAAPVINAKAAALAAVQHIEVAFLRGSVEGIIQAIADVRALLTDVPGT